MSYFTHAFEGLVERHALGTGPRRMTYLVVWLPDPLARDLPLGDNPRLRIEAEVADYPVNGAFMPTAGRWYLKLPREVVKGAALAPGRLVEVRFRIADQSAVEVPEELSRALLSDPEAAAKWEKLTPGKRRGMSYRVGSAKQAATRVRRADEILAELKDGR